jgi:hypothetical protein
LFAEYEEIIWFCGAGKFVRFYFLFLFLCLSGHALIALLIPTKPVYLGRYSHLHLSDEIEFSSFNPYHEEEPEIALHFHTPILLKKEKRIINTDELTLFDISNAALLGLTQLCTLWWFRTIHLIG